MDVQKLIAEPDGKFRLKDRAPDETYGTTKARAAKALPAHAEKLSHDHDLLYAEHKHGLLIVLQGMDASGKDGAIRHVMSGFNPQGSTVTSFKQPTSKELDHDFLWRIHQAVPGKGEIGIFNRSQYEDVLIVRVHKLVPKKVWSKRYEQINQFEEMLTMNNVCILKFFLHISREEQQKRFHARLQDPSKNWKASVADFKEQAFWSDYQEAYEDAINECSTKYAPWYVIPSDHKWFRNYAISSVIVDTLESLGMTYPKADPDVLRAAEGEAERQSPA